MHMKIDNNSSTKYYQKTKEAYKKCPVKDIKMLPKKKKKLVEYRKSIMEFIKV